MAGKCTFPRQFCFGLSNRPYQRIFNPPLTVATYQCGEAFCASLGRERTKVDVASVDFVFFGLADRGFVHDDQAPGVGQFHFGRLYRVNAQVSFFDPSVAFA